MSRAAPTRPAHDDTPVAEIHAAMVATAVCTPPRASLTTRFQWIVATEMKIFHVLPQYMLQACLVRCFTAMLTHTWVLPKLSLVVVCNGPIVTCDNLSNNCADGFWCFDCRLSFRARYDYSGCPRHKQPG